MTILAQDPNCPDCCIISVPVPPKTGLGVTVEITEGRNLIRTRVGYVNHIYHSDSMGEASLTLTPGESYTITSLTSLFVSTDQPVNVTIIADGVSATLGVVRMLFIDNAYDKVIIENPATVASETNARVLVAFTNNT